MIFITSCANNYFYSHLSHYVSMTLADLLNTPDLDFVRFSHEVKLTTGFLVTG
jgi:hypothetical protein